MLPWWRFLEHDEFYDEYRMISNLNMMKSDLNMMTTKQNILNLTRTQNMITFNLNMMKSKQTEHDGS